MLDIPVFHEISIDTYKQEKPQTIIFADGVYINLYIKLSKGERNTHHFMLDLHKENTTPRKTI